MFEKHRIHIATNKKKDEQFQFISVQSEASFVCYNHLCFFGENVLTSLPQNA